MSVNAIQRAIHDLLTTEPFFAHFLLGAKMMYDEKRVPTAGVCIQDGLPTFIFNRDYISTLTVGQAKSLIKHEVLHLLFRHTDKTLFEQLKVKYANIANIHELANIAQDCAINQYLNEVQEGWVTLQNLSEQVGTQLLPFQTSDYYLDAIMKSPKIKNVSRGGDCDEHLQDDGTPDQMGKAAVDRLAKKAMNQSAGNVPQNLLKHLGSLPEPKLNWKTLLRNFVARNITHEFKASYKKINRRFDLPIPGKIHKKTMTLGVCTDSSGSVSDEAFMSFLAEVQSIAKSISKTYLVDADCVVQDVKLIKGNQKLKAERKGGGGTAYQPAITKCMELGCDVIVYFGDFDTADTPKNPGVPFLWVGVGNSPAPASFGKVVRLDP